jgi:uncharacterized SAM-binding protein YcdF (DUF218 family)
MKRVIAAILFTLLIFMILPTIPVVRAWLAAPLIVTDNAAAGDACYVLAAGNAIWERLAAASDLYHMKRVPMVILMQSGETGPYNFPAQSSWNQTQWELEYLVSRGVPKENVVTIETGEGFFGTLSEARVVARTLPPEVKKLVLVTSAPHTRRSLLIFKRLLSANVQIIPFAATTFETSAEMYDPLWLEYLKLFVYAAFLFR